MQDMTPDERRRRNADDDRRIDANAVRTRSTRNWLAGFLLLLVASVVLYYFYRRQLIQHSDTMFFRAVPLGGH